MQIRPYRDSDEQAVVRLWTAALPGTAPHHDGATSIRKKLQVDCDLLLVAEVAGEVVGTAMGGYDGHRGWIYSVAVHSSHRRHGIGTALIRRLESLLVERGCLKVNLQVLTSNKAVVDFYAKLGYTVEERISMGKRLYH
jgi:ribosomal protein S18 acetylase RimI-like enzyme